MVMNRNEAAWEAARRVFPGGVNSPVRAFKSVGGTPRFMHRGSGSRMWDVDGTEYIDYVGAWGPQILGHAHPAVTEAIQKACQDGTAFGTPGERETELAHLVMGALPSIEVIRFVNSGTEATMSALRLARGFTRRSKILKFAGCYHGHGDGLLVKAGSGAMTFGVPDSAGVPTSVAGETLVARYNDLADVDRVFDQHAGDLAAVILEPVVGNMGLVPPAPGFLEGLRERCTRAGALLVFDEVMTGFRVARGSAQGRFGIRPDLTCLGKIVGGGLPVGAYGGRREIMDLLAPSGPVYQAGTNSGNPVVMAAGIATLSLLTDELYAGLEARAAQLVNGLRAAAGQRAIVQNVGSMMTLFWRKEGSAATAIRNYDDTVEVDAEKFGRLFHHYLDRGVYMPPSTFEAFFLSAAHTASDVDRTLEVFRSFA